MSTREDAAAVVTFKLYFNVEAVSACIQQLSGNFVHKVTLTPGLFTFH